MLGTIISLILCGWQTHRRSLIYRKLLQFKWQLHCLEKSNQIMRNNTTRLYWAGHQQTCIHVVCSKLCRETTFFVWTNEYHNGHLNSNQTQKLNRIIIVGSTRSCEDWKWHNNSLFNNSTYCMSTVMTKWSSPDFWWWCRTKVNGQTVGAVVP